MQNRKTDLELRRRAEEEVQEKERTRHLSEQDVRKLCHELEVYQVELELQNEALQELQHDLRASEEKYRDLYDFAPVGYATLDAGGQILEANLAAASLLGEPRAHLANQRLQFFLERESIGDFNAFCARVFRSGDRETVEVWLRANQKRAAVWVRVEGQAIPERPEQGQVFRAALIDITNRKRVEEERALLHTRLEQAHREANLYLDIMIHDIRNTNNVSGMYADLIVELAEGNLKTYAERLNDSIRRSTEILRNVATIRRVHQESANLIPVSLDAAIRSEIKNFPEVSIHYHGRPVDVLADSLLPMVFTNLLGNAAKFGGPDVEITVWMEERDGEVLVSVEDTGPGVPDEMKEQIFQRFERGMGQGKGEGLGLFIVRTLVERYGGKVWAEDRVQGHPEEGATFRFTLREGGVNR